MLSQRLITLGRKLADPPQTIDPKSFSIAGDTRAELDEVCSSAATSLLIACSTKTSSDCKSMMPQIVEEETGAGTLIKLPATQNIAGSCMQRCRLCCWWTAAAMLKIQKENYCGQKGQKAQLFLV